MLSNVYVYVSQTVCNYNGLTGSLPNGVVPPFRAIMVQINTNGNTLPCQQLIVPQAMELIIITKGYYLLSLIIKTVKLKW